MRLVIRSVFFAENAVEIVYMDLDRDVRARGTVAMSHTLSIDTQQGDYGSEREAVEAAAVLLLQDALEDFSAPPTFADIEGD